MKKALLSVLLILGFLLIIRDNLNGQFPRIYGTSGNDGINKVIPAGTEYYVLGYTGANPNSTWKATISRLNSAGSVLWTKTLDIFSQWNDGVVTPNGDLLLVGTTLPYSASSQSLMGLINSSGTFAFVRSSNVIGREILNRIVLNPVPQNNAFPYYILGDYFPGSGRNTILMVVDASGNIGWKKKYSSSSTYSFSRDLEALPNGDLLLTGGAVFRADNSGQLYNAFAIEVPSLFRFYDVAQKAGGGFYAIGSEGGNFDSQLIKLDQDYLEVWQIAIPNLQGVSQVWSVGNDIYVTASRSIGPTIQGVLLKFRDNGTSPSYLWTKYLKLNETLPFGLSALGFTTFLAPNKIIWADYRRRANGYGWDDGFISVSDMDFNTCMTQMVPDNIVVKNNQFFSPVLPSIEFVDVLTPASVTSSSVSWSSFDACLTDCDCSFSSMQIHGPNPAQFQPVVCGGPPVTLGCQPGMGYTFTGIWGPSLSAIQVNWILSGPGASQTGTYNGSGPYFSLNLLPTYFTQPGLYTLTLQGKCGDKICPCIIQFNVNCPDPCPCEISDLLAFQANVANGFATSFASSSCQVCFSPLALSGCQTVEWKVNPFTGPPIGTSTGNQTFCHTFSGPGTYNIQMVVTQKKADGTICETFAKTQTVTVTCGPMAPTGNPLLKNSSFNETPVAGGLTTGGSAPGWSAGAGDPVLVGSAGGSQDSWGIAISGNATAYDMLISTDPVCISKTEDGALTLRVRTWGDPHETTGDGKVWKDPKKGKLAVQLGSGQGMGCTGANCYNLATLVDFLPLETDEWFEVRIPFNLSSWITSESCAKGSGTIPVRVLISVSNPFTDSQGDGRNRDAILIDNISFNSLNTGVETPFLPGGTMSLYPNPTSGSFTLEMAQAPSAGTFIRIIKPSGQVVLERQAQAGECIQTLDSGSMPAGLYFVQVLTEGRLVGVEKLIKQ